MKTKKEIKRAIAKKKPTRVIEIITEKVDMPEYDKRRFQYKPKDLNGRKWFVTDTETNNIVYNGKYEMTAMVCHSFNKKHYKQVGYGK